MNAPEIILTDNERDELTKIAESSNASAALRLRARIVLQAADGTPSAAIASALGISRPTVIKWRSIFALAAGDRISCLISGRRTNPRHELVIETVLHEVPYAMRWTTRGLEGATRVSRSTVQRVLRNNSIRPADAGVLPQIRLPDDLENRVYDIAGIIRSGYLTAIVFVAWPRRRFLLSAEPPESDERRKGVGRFISIMHEVVVRPVAGLQVQLAAVIQFLQEIRTNCPETELHVVSEHLASTPERVKAWESALPNFIFHRTPNLTMCKEPFIAWLERWAAALARTRSGVTVLDAMCRSLDGKCAINPSGGPLITRRCCH